MTLKSKKKNTQIDWLIAYSQQVEFAKTTEGKQRVEYLINLALSRIPKGKCVYGWSGGKDALALQCICEIAKIKDCVLGTIGFQWEYPSFIKFLKTNSPENLIIKDQHINTDFLNKNEEMLFPIDSRIFYKWYVKDQKAYYDFAKEKKADFIILGHRQNDGNIVNKGQIRNKIFPMWDFSHEDIFLILSYFKKRLPEIYYYKDGFCNGTHTWITRPGKEKAMSEIWNIDKTILLKYRDIRLINNFLLKKGV